MKRLTILFLLLASAVFGQTIPATVGLYSSSVSASSGGGAGTVTVVGGGTLTSTAIVTGGGLQTVQTPSATTTLDTSGNLSTPGGASFGVGGSAAGYLEVTQGTAPGTGTTSIKLYAPTSVTSYLMELPGSVGSTGVFIGTVSGSTVTLSKVAPGTSGNVLTSNGTTWTSAAATGAVSSVTGDQGFGSVSPTTGAVVVNFFTPGEHIVRQLIAPSSGTTWGAVGGLSASVGGTPSFITPTATKPAGISYVSGNVSGNVANVSTGTTFQTFGNLPVSVSRVAALSFNGVAQRFFIGMSEASVDGSDNPNNTAFALFRYSTSAGDTHWMIGTNDGTGTGTFADSGVTPDANIHTFKIVCSSGHVKFYIDGTLVTNGDRTSDLPTGTSIVREPNQVETLEAVAKTIEVYQVTEITQ